MTLVARTMEAIHISAGAPLAALIAACRVGFAFQADLTAASPILSDIVAKAPSLGAASTWLMGEAWR